MASASEKKPKGEATDLALVYSRSDDGRSYGVVRRKDDEVQVGTLRQLEEGKPIHGELVKLRSRPESPALFDVETQVGIPATREAVGPAKVATPAYRAGWDSIWARKSGSTALN